MDTLPSHPDRSHSTLAGLLGLVAVVAILLAWKAVPARQRLQRVEAAREAAERENIENLRRLVSTLSRISNRDPQLEGRYQWARQTLQELEAKAGAESTPSAMTPIIIHVASRDLGWNRPLPEGFELGTLPDGGYGVKWRGRGSRGLGSWTYWVPWEPPQKPIRIEFDGRVFILCPEGTPEVEIRDAPTVPYASEQEVR